MDEWSQERGGDIMYTSEEVQKIRGVAREIRSKEPSSHLIEFLVDKADEPSCGLDELQMLIDVCGASGKLGSSVDDNRKKAGLLNDLMQFVSNDPKEETQRIKRAMALRYVNKLRSW